MKKFYFLFLLVFIASFSQAQNFTKVWTKYCNGTDFAWFNTNANPAPGFINSTTALAYNPVTNKLLVGNRQDSIYILNATTGAQEGTLKLGGDIGAEAFKFNKIRCTSDGVIYAISLATGAGTNNGKIYRWADQNATPTLCVNWSTTERCGDAFGLSGTGNNTVLYASGAALAGGTADTKIYIFTTVNGTTFLNTSTLTITSGTGTAGQWANRAVEPIGTTPTAGIWTDMSGGPGRRHNITGSAPTYFSSVGYTTVAGYNNGQAADAYTALRYLQTPGNKKYVAFCGANNSGDGVTMRMLDVTNEMDVKTVGTDTLYASGGGYFMWQTNINGTGDIAFKANGNGSYDIFYLATNNAISCVRSATTLPVELVSFSTQLSKNSVKLNWTTANEINNVGFEIEKSIDGERFKSIGFTKALGNANNNYEFADANAATSKVNKLFYRLKQIDKDGQFTYSRVEVVSLPMEKNYALSSIENPIRNEIRLIVAANKESNLTINVTNSSGQIVSTKNIVTKQGNNIISLPVMQFAKGLYYVIATDGTSRQSISVMKN